MIHSLRTAVVASSFAFAAMASPAISFAQSSPAELVDIDGLLAYFPDNIVASYDDVSLDQTTGYTVVTNFRLTSDDETEFGIVVGELIVSGFDQDLFQQRINGLNFAESGILFDYLQAKDTSLFGVDALMNEINRSSYAILAETTEGLGPEGDEQVSDVFAELAEQGSEYTSLDFRIDDITIDDVLLLPFEPPAAADIEQNVKGVKEEGEDREFDEALVFLQSYFAGMRAIGAEDASISGMRLQLGTTGSISEDQPLDFNFSVSNMSISDWRGGDIGASSMTGLLFRAEGPIDEAQQEDGLPLERLSLTGSIGSYRTTDIRFDEGYRWLVKGEWPPASATDLISFGTSEFTDYRLNFLDAPFFNLESGSVDMSGFHWLIPTRIDMGFDDITFDFGSFFDAIIDASSEETDELNEIVNVLDILEPYGLSAPTFDVDMSWRWDAEEGPASIGMNFDMAEYGRFTVTADGAFSDFASLYAAFADENEDGLDGAELLAATSTLSNFTIEMEDYGGIDKMFEIVVELAKVAPEDSELAPFAAFDPQGLKGMAVGMLALTSPQISAEFPEAAEYIAAASAYISQGGILRMAIDPDTPIGAETFGLIGLADSPSEMVDLLSFSVEHIPPAAE